MHITICETDDQSRFDGNMALKAGALEPPRGRGWGGVRRGFEIGGTRTPVADSRRYMGKTTITL